MLVRTSYFVQLCTVDRIFNFLFLLFKGNRKMEIQEYANILSFVLGKLGLSYLKVKISKIKS